MRCYTESMSAIVATCFTLSLLLGNICSQQLLAYAAEAQEPTSFITSVEGHLACKKSRAPQSFTHSIPQSNRCASGHCLAGNPADAALTMTRGTEQQVPFSPPLLSKIPAPLPSALPSALTAHFPIGPPLLHLATIVLRI